MVYNRENGGNSKTILGSIVSDVKLIHLLTHSVHSTNDKQWLLSEFAQIEVIPYAKI